MGKTQSYHNLLDAFTQAGCPICRMTLCTVDRYIDSINYEYINDPGFRAAVEPAWGFCNVHAQHWLRQAHPLGTALIYQNVLRRISKELRGLRPNQPGILASVTSFLGGNEIGTSHEDCKALRAPRQCPICQIRTEHERTSIDSLLDGLAEDEFRDAYAQSAGLCLPHVRLALCQTTNTMAFTLLRDRALAEYELLDAQLNEIIRKHDYRFRDEPSGEEQGATDRAVHYVTGAPGIEDR